MLAALLLNLSRPSQAVAERRRVVQEVEFDYEKAAQEDDFDMLEIVAMFMQTRNSKWPH